MSIWYTMARMPITSFDTPFLKKEKASNDAWRFYFEKPPKFEYDAGQYVKVKLKIKKPDSRGVTRYFTLSSSPTEPFLLITTRIIKSTFKLTLGKIKKGKEVRFRGPWGDFTLQKDDRPVVFIAGGIGITPFRSMIKFVHDTKLKKKITLLVSYKTPEEILYKDEFEKIQSKIKNIKVVTTITQPEGTGWKGEAGRIDEGKIKKHIANFKDNLYYIAGPDPLVDAMEKLLLGMKIKKQSILKDGFPGYKWL
jgi:ferredoxin-NADP reductase